MSFVRKNRGYHYLVESYRTDGTVRHHNIAYLGKYATVENAIDGLPSEISRANKRMLYWKCRSDEMRPLLKKEKMLGKKDGPGPVKPPKQSPPSARLNRFYEAKTRYEIEARRLTALNRRLERVKAYLAAA